MYANLYKVDGNGISSSNETNGNLIIISEPKDKLRDIEDQFGEEYDLPMNMFDLTVYPVLAPRVEKINTRNFGETVVLILSNIKDAEGERDSTTEERLESVSLVLNKEKLFVFMNEESTVMETFFNNHKNQVQTLEEVILYTAMEIYKSYISELKDIKETIDELNRRAEDATTEKKLLKVLTDTERDIVNIQQTLDRMGDAVKPLLKDETFIHNIRGEDLLYNIKWLDAETKDFADVNRGLLEALSGHFTTIMSRNLNTLMKFLNSLSLVLSAASLVFAIWGMSTDGLPLEQNSYGFYIVLFVAAVAAFGMALYLRKRKYF